jgi:type II secretory pathway pseudopilin PulG
MIKMKEKYDNQKGFTLIEITVAFFVLAMGVMAVFTLINRNVAVANLTKNELIASHLAQEGIEITRNIRDSDWHAGNPFGFSLANGTWRVQHDSTSLIILGSNPFLNVGTTDGIYGYGVGLGSPFKRTVQISTNVGEASIRRIVVVDVTWEEGGLTKSVKAEEHLYNWR